MHDAFVGTDGDGNFILEGKPWPIHAAVYFGRRPGTCGADWLGEHFEHNLRFLDRDLELMRDLGINTVGLFVSGGKIFDGTMLNQKVYGRILRILDAISNAGLRVILFGGRSIGRDAWCDAHKIDPAAHGLWHAAVNEEARKAMIAGAALFREPLAGRPEIIGHITHVGRFFRFDFTVPRLRAPWAMWLERRFGGDFARCRQAFRLERDERTWSKVRMPVEMEPYFNEHNPRSFEFAVMQQTLVTEANHIVYAALKRVTPQQLLFSVMEGCSFSTGHLTTLIPEQMAGDAAWIECYNWEGLRAHHIQSGEEQKWMAEPVAAKPAVEIIGNAGYVELVSRWMQGSRRPFLLCHGVDIGEQRRGVRDESDQAVMIDRFAGLIQATGAHGMAYWCWTDDEQSKTYTRTLGFEWNREIPREERPYSQSGETMGILRFKGTMRPVGEKIRSRAEALRGKAAARASDEVLVLLPSPDFQGLGRYRANLSAFGVLTVLARLGVLAEARWTSAGERVIGSGDVADCRLIVLATPEYQRDHAGVPPLLDAYVRQGGALFLPLGLPDKLQDEYLRWQDSPHLQALSGVTEIEEIEEVSELGGISSTDMAFTGSIPSRWRLPAGRRMKRVEPVARAEILARADNTPLLYRHVLGDGRVYVFTWSLDVLIYEGEQLDYPGDDWDWLFKGILQELSVQRDQDNEMTRIVRSMTRSDAAAGL
jgi:hypothetical protein